jgi:hypothetical protein
MLPRKPAPENGGDLEPGCKLEGKLQADAGFARVRAASRSWIAR